jgi:hypothetical protein
MMPTLPQPTNKPDAPVVSEAETLAQQWSEFLPLELTLARAKQIINFVQDNEPDDPALVVLKYCLGRMDQDTRMQNGISVDLYRSKLIEMHDNIYRKQGFQFVSRVYASHFAIPALDMPLLTFDSVNRYLDNTPVIFSTGYRITPAEAIEKGKKYVAHGHRIDTLTFFVWSL